MRIIGKRTVAVFATRNLTARASLDHWLRETVAASWANAAEVLAPFSNAEMLSPERVRFEVAGGDFLLICAFDFLRGVACVKFIGTPAEYDSVAPLMSRRSERAIAMDIHPIRTDNDLAAALARVDAIWGAEPGTPEGDELDFLIVLIEEYENKLYPIVPIHAPTQRVAPSRLAPAPECGGRIHACLRA